MILRSLLSVHLDNPLHKRYFPHSGLTSIATTCHHFLLPACSPCLKPAEKQQPPGASMLHPTLIQVPFASDIHHIALPEGPWPLSSSTYSL
jgi:hypothetical protein